ncbi:hypothetical protein K3R59_001837 [Salmonella enterica]|nr:hypothetical protein [Salmonella enterica]
MKKSNFIELIHTEIAKGSTRFCVAASGYGEAVLYWTTEKGQRVWSVLSGNRGKHPASPSESTKKKITTFRQWLEDVGENEQSLKLANECYEEYLEDSTTVSHDELMKKNQGDNNDKQI